MSKRIIRFYNHHFNEFYLAQTEKVRKKILQTLILIETLDVIPTTILRSIEGVKGLYEIRVEFSSNIFFGCTSLKTLTLPKNITTIDQDYSFNGSNFEKIYIPCDSTFDFYLDDYAVSYVNGTTYLSDTKVEVLESHSFGNWTNIGNGKKQREKRRAFGLAVKRCLQKRSSCS